MVSQPGGDAAIPRCRWLRWLPLHIIPRESHTDLAAVVVTFSQNDIAAPRGTRHHLQRDDCQLPRKERDDPPAGRGEISHYPSLPFRRPSVYLIRVSPIFLNTFESTKYCERRLNK